MKRLSILALLLSLACKREGPGIRGDEAAAPREQRPSTLVGRWRADGSGRELEAREKNGVVTFHVVKPAEWQGAYLADEIRFSIREASGGLLVTDRYRPFDLEPGVHYDGETGRTTCLRELTADEKGRPLRAELTGETLAVDFAHVRQAITPDSTSLEVLSCREPEVIGVLRRTLRRVKAP
jgi:hypothetical protein